MLSFQGSIVTCFFICYISTCVFHVSNIRSEVLALTVWGLLLFHLRIVTISQMYFHLFCSNSVECFLDKNIDKKKTIRIFYIIILFASFYEN